MNAFKRSFNRLIQSHVELSVHEGIESMKLSSGKGLYWAFEVFLPSYLCTEQGGGADDLFLKDKAFSGFLT